MSALKAKFRKNFEKLSDDELVELYNKGKYKEGIEEEVLLEVMQERELLEAEEEEAEEAPAKSKGKSKEKEAPAKSKKKAVIEDDEEDEEDEDDEEDEAPAKSKKSTKPAPSAGVKSKKKVVEDDDDEDEEEEEESPKDKSKKSAEAKPKKESTREAIPEKKFSAKYEVGDKVSFSAKGPQESVGYVVGKPVKAEVMGVKRCPTTGLAYYTLHYKGKSEDLKGETYKTNKLETSLLD